MPKKGFALKASITVFVYDDGTVNLWAKTPINPAHKAEIYEQIKAALDKDLK